MRHCNAREAQTFTSVHQIMARSSHWGTILLGHMAFHTPSINWHSTNSAVHTGPSNQIRTRPSAFCRRTSLRTLKDLYKAHVYSTQSLSHIGTVSWGSDRILVSWDIALEHLNLPHHPPITTLDHKAVL